MGFLLVVRLAMSSTSKRMSVAGLEDISNKHVAL